MLKNFENFIINGAGINLFSSKKNTGIITRKSEKSNYLLLITKFRTQFSLILLPILLSYFE